MLREQRRHLLVELTDVLLDELQLLQRHLQQSAVDRIEFRARPERVAQLFRGGPQLLICQGGQSCWLRFSIGERMQHASGTGAQQVRD